MQCERLRTDRYPRREEVTTERGTSSRHNPQKARDTAVQPHSLGNNVLQIGECKNALRRSVWWQTRDFVTSLRRTSWLRG